MSSLYELSGELLQLQSMLEDDVDADVLADTLEAVEGEYEVKLESYCKVMTNLLADVDALKAEEKRLSGKRKVLESNVDRLKKSMYDSLKATGKDKVKGQLFTISIQKNGGKIPVVADPEANTLDLPDDLVTIKESANLDAIRDFLQAGNVLDHYHLGERGDSLRIK